MIQIIPILDYPIVKSQDDFWSGLSNSLKDIILDDDIVIMAHTPYSRVFGPKYQISKVQPSKKAQKIALEINKSPEKTQIVLDLSTEIVKIGRNVIISENKAGVVCANAGADESNAELGYVIGVPDDPDAVALEIKKFIQNTLNTNVAVIISDTVGRALRRGAVNIAIGVAGISAMRSDIGKQDLFGYEMKVSEVAIADEIASAAELLQGQTDGGIPLVIVRGFSIDFNEVESARMLNRPKEERLFS